VCSVKTALHQLAKKEAFNRPLNQGRSTHCTLDHWLNQLLIHSSTAKNPDNASPKGIYNCHMRPKPFQKQLSQGRPSESVLVSTDQYEHVSNDLECRQDNTFVRYRELALKWETGLLRAPADMNRREGEKDVIPGR